MMRWLLAAAAMAAAATGALADIPPVGGGRPVLHARRRGRGAPRHDQAMKEDGLRITAAALVATLAATAAIADVLPPARPARPSDARQVTGIVRGFAGASLALRDPQTGATTSFNLYGHRGPARADNVGLRLGDTAVVTVRADLARDEAYTVDRVLPDGRTSIRVFALDLPHTPPALAHGQGCWIATRAGESIELCFTSLSRGLALRYGADGALACAAPLTLQRERFAAAPAACRDGASWPVQSVACDGKDTCRVALADQTEQMLAMTRR